MALSPSVFAFGKDYPGKSARPAKNKIAAELPTITLGAARKYVADRLIADTIRCPYITTSRYIGGFRANNCDNFLSAAARRVRSRLAPSEMRIAFGS